MTINYQVVMDMIVNFMYVSFPVAIIFALTDRIIRIFKNFVSGKEVIL